MSSRVDSHTVSVAENIFTGDAYAPGAQSGGRGIPRVGFVEADLGTPEIQDVNGYVVSEATPLGAVTLDGALVTAGVGIADVARSVRIVSTTTDTTQTLTVTGTDAYGAGLVENITLNGATPVDGLKAFKTVTGITVDLILVGSLTVGTSDVLGLPFGIAETGDVIATSEAGVPATTGTVVVADTTNPATAITGDVRGTYNPTVVLDGSIAVKLFYKPAGRKTITAYGVPQFTV